MSDGFASLVVGLAAVVGSIVVARISRPADDPHADPATQHDLTTIAGLAGAFSEQHAQMADQARQIGELQTRQREHEEHARLQDRIIAAFRRRSSVLEDAMRTAGVPIPEIDPEDAALISGI